MIDDDKVLGDQLKKEQRLEELKEELADKKDQLASVQELKNGLRLLDEEHNQADEKEVMADIEREIESL